MKNHETQFIKVKKCQLVKVKITNRKLYYLFEHVIVLCNNDCIKKL